MGARWGPHWAAAGPHLDAEVAPVDVVPQEQVTGAAGGAAHLKQLHEVEELSVDVATHWEHTHTHTHT